MTLVFIIVSCLLGGYIFYQVIVQNKSAKSLIRREFSGLELTDDKSALNLYRRNQKEVGKVIKIDDINQFQVILGDIAISTINTTIDHAFNAPKENNLRDIFHNEQVAKMVDGKVRRIGLRISAHEKEIYVLCLYLRKGSDRITGSSYFEEVDNAIDWCWYFSNFLNSKQTGKRILKPKLTVAEIAQAEHKTYDDTPLHAQAALIRPTYLSQRITSEVSINSEESSHIEEITFSNENKGGTTLDDSYDIKTPKEYNQIEADLGYDLDKIIELQQQGFLTIEEFSEAKTTLLSNLNKADR